MSTATAPMSIVHLLAPARFGGLETVVTTLAAGQVAAGDRVTVGLVLTPGDAEDHPVGTALRGAGADVEPMIVAGRDYRGERSATRALLRRADADVLHTHGYRPDVVDAPVARGLSVPTVTTVHGFTGGGWRGRFYEWLQVRSFRRFQAVIAVSRKIHDELADRGIDPSRLHVVRNAWSATVAPLERGEARARLGLDDRGPVVGWVGRMSREKAADVMIRAAGATECATVAFSMVGSGAMEAECRDLARSLGIDRRIVWHGVVPDVAPLLGAFDALVLTSWTEGTPMILLEAMAAGVPVVTTAVGGIPDVVTASEAHLCEAGDVAGIARAIDDVLSEPEAAARRAEAARSRLGTELAVDPWIERHRSIYETLIES